MIETREHNGKTFQHIDPATIDLTKMTEIQKVTSVWAYQLKAGEKLEVETKSGGIIETTNTAYEGDWVVYNIGNSFGDSLKERIANADMKVITDEAFHRLYRIRPDSDGDGSSYADYEDTKGQEYSYTGKSIYVARVPFNFFIRAPWGEDQFIEEGGYIVYNTNTSHSGHPDIYGTAGAQGGVPDQLENTYMLVKDLKNVDKRQKQVNEKTMRDLYRHVIACDRSPIAGIQFNAVDLQRAHERIGQQTEKWEHKR